MDKEKKLPQRKPTRLKTFDYSANGVYFITICTEKRKNILSRIPVGGDVPDAPYSDVLDAPYSDVLDAPYSDVLDALYSDVLDAPCSDVVDSQNNVILLPHGLIAEKYINQLNAFYDNIIVNLYVIMPNHIHIMLTVLGSGASRTSPPTRQHSVVSQFVSTFKRFCNKEYGENIWQRHFYDHIIRNREDYESHIKYIYDNPKRWYYDELYSENDLSSFS